MGGNHPRSYALDPWAGGIQRSWKEEGGFSGKEQHKLPAEDGMGVMEGSYT